MPQDTTVKKVQSAQSPRGPEGQIYLVSGTRSSMRMWKTESPGEPDPETRREYETVGYVIDGKAKLFLEDQTITLERGDSYLVPEGAAHRYEYLEPFTAVEVTSPPARVHGRDEGMV